MMAGATTRKLELVKLAIRLALADKAPQWKILDPVGTFQRISRSPFREGRIDLEGGSWTTPREVLESYLSQADAELDLSSEEQDSARECQELLEARFANPAKFARSVDWAAKHSLILACMEDRESTWSDPLAQSLDLAYSDLDPEEGLFGALSEMGAIEIQPHQADVRLREVEVCEPTRALARSAAVQKFKGQIKRINWSSITFATPQGEKEIYLPPNAIYPEAIHDVEHLEDFIRHIEELNDDQG